MKVQRSWTGSSLLLLPFLFLSNLLHTTLALKVSSAVPLSDFNLVSVSTCHTQGYDYYDSSLYACQLCPTHQERSTTYLDNIGNSASCQCKAGYERVDNSCVDVSFFFFLYSFSNKIQN